MILIKSAPPDYYVAGRPASIAARQLHRTSELLPQRANANFRQGPHSVARHLYIQACFAPLITALAVTDRRVISKT